MYGDSKVVDDWINDKNELQVVTLNNWLIKIKELVLTFSRIIFEHIYIKHNMEVESLSKIDLRMQEGIIFFQLFQECILVEQGQLKIF